MTDVASPHNLTNVASTKANNGAGIWDELEQRLEPYETKARDKAEAQEMVDLLEEVDSDLVRRCKS